MLTSNNINVVALSTEVHAHCQTARLRELHGKKYAPNKPL